MAALDDGIKGELLKMEEAARVMMANNVDANQRREAESYFIRLRDSNIAPQVCQTILETTTEPFVIFQISQCFALSLARNYDMYAESDIQGACKYLLELPINKEGLPTFAVAELFKSAAIIYKRGQKCKPQLILDLVTTLLRNSADNLQVLGLKIIEALCLEHATLWRSSIATSYQQHLLAKKRFEEHLLKKFMEFSLECLSKFVQSDYASTHADVCDRFLRVAVLVLQWNFTNSVPSTLMRLPLYTANTFTALRPPPSWASLFQDEQLLPFFFELHRNVRQNSLLAQNSLNCISRLAGVMGSVLDEPRGTDKRAIQGEVKPHDLYVRRFCTSLIDVFKDCHPHELLQFTGALHQIFSHHPMPIFKRFPQGLLDGFIEFIAHWSCQLASPAMTQDKENDELGMIESLSNVFCSWSIILRSCPTFKQPVYDLVMRQNSLIIETFVKTVLAPPFGQRTAISNDETGDDDDELEDYKVYGIIITDIGVFSRATVDPFAKYLLNTFHERINQRQIVAENAISNDQRYLWFEDVHWLLMLIGSFFNDSDKDIAVFLDNAYKNGEYNRVDLGSFLIQCLQNTENFNAPPNTDPLVIICGMVSHWAGILLQSLEKQGHASPFVSPEICRSTLRTFATIISFLTNLNEDQSSFFDESATSKLSALPAFESTGERSAQLIDFIIRLCFSIFREFPAEKRLCDTAVAFLVQESEKRAQYIATSPLLYEQLTSITLERLPCRRDFMTCLVTVGSNLTNGQERSQMHDMILQPMANRFLEAAQSFQTGQTNLAPHLVDLLECFSGIAKGAQIESGNILYTYLLPILHTCIRLIPLSSDIKPLTDGILDLFKNVANTLFIFVDLKAGDSPPVNNQDDFFNLLYNLFEAYKLSQMKRFRTAASLAEIEEEEQISDLVTLLQTISSSITRPYLLFTSPGDPVDNSAMPLCQRTLEMILPLLNEEVLRLPTLSNTFFRLLLNISEASPTVFLLLDNFMAEQLLKCLCWAIGGASGLEPTRLALEAIIIICRTLNMSTDTEQGPFAFALFNVLVGKLFEIAIHSSTELDMDLQLTSIRGLYAIIRLNRQLFTEYINNMFGRPDNAQNYARLIAEFNGLLPPAEQLSDSRQAFRSFHTRFEKFASAVESILIV